jgi:3',5'-nucleoside bisphosphate phosphatase
LILSGQEITTPDIGDVLVYGADATIKKGTSLKLTGKLYPDAGHRQGKL